MHIHARSKVEQSEVKQSSVVPRHSRVFSSFLEFSRVFSSILEYSRAFWRFLENSRARRLESWRSWERIPSIVGSKGFFCIDISTEHPQTPTETLHKFSVVAISSNCKISLASSFSFSSSFTFLHSYQQMPGWLLGPSVISVLLLHL